jgi:hypothetical protein
LSRDIANQKTAVSRRRLENVTLEDVQILFPNFEGREDKYNAKGDRNFSILLNEETAAMLEEQGWNIRTLKSRDEDEPPRPYLKVAVSYKYENRSPRVILITSRGRNPLDEGMVSMLDVVDIDTVDVTLNPSRYDINGNQGVKAYLKTMYMKIVEDPLDLKYAEYEPEVLAIDAYGDDDEIYGEVIDDVKELEG